MTGDPKLIATAASFHELVSANADRSNEARQQVPEVAEALAEAGLHRLGVPKSVGGIGADPITMIRAIEEVSAVDGSTGWTLMLGIEALGVASGFLPTETISNILDHNPATIMAASVAPIGTAVPAEGGYLISGRWSWASGINNADWWWCGCIIDDGSNRRPRSTVQALIPTDQITVFETWDGSGLAGSGSHDVEVDQIYVPASHTTDIYGGAPISDDPLFAMPVLSRFAFNKIGVATGISRAALDNFIDLAKAKTPRGERNPLAERPRAQLAIAEAEASLNGGRAWAFEVVRELWTEACAGRSISNDLHARVRLASSNAVQAAMSAVDKVHSAAGTSPNQRNSPLDRRFRDVHAVPQQITVAPYMIETAGRVLLGLEPEHQAF